MSNGVGNLLDRTCTIGHLQDTPGENVEVAGGKHSQIDQQIGIGWSSMASNLYLDDEIVKWCQSKSTVLQGLRHHGINIML